MLLWQRNRKRLPRLRAKWEPLGPDRTTSSTYRFRAFTRNESGGRWKRTYSTAAKVVALGEDDGGDARLRRWARYGCPFDLGTRPREVDDLRDLAGVVFVVRGVVLSRRTSAEAVQSSGGCGEVGKLNLLPKEKIQRVRRTERCKIRRVTGFGATGNHRRRRKLPAKLSGGSTTPASLSGRSSTRKLGFRRGNWGGRSGIYSRVIKLARGSRNRLDSARFPPGVRIRGSSSRTRRGERDDMWDRHLSGRERERTWGFGRRMVLKSGGWKQPKPVWLPNCVAGRWAESLRARGKGMGCGPFSLGSCDSFIYILLYRIWIWFK